MIAMHEPQSTQPAQPSLSVKKSILVEAPQAHAFAVFTERHGAWWPLADKHIGKVAAETAIMEPRAGGRWFERGVDGSETEWGRVLVWEPPHRLVLAWEISAQWQHDPGLVTEVEVRFIAAGPRTTRVELEHRHLERYGDQAERMQSGIGSEGGWPSILKDFAAAATAPA
jgi:uncharacterized protein YndB with AHSA1/START domain